MLLGSLVGQGANLQTRQALRIVDAMAPCVLMLDEVEEGIVVVCANSGQTDSAAFRPACSRYSLLRLAQRSYERRVRCLYRQNDVQQVTCPEFTRAERFDGLFFLDLPNAQQKQTIWRQYLRLFELDTQQRLPEDTNWTGAEIRSCCRLAALLDVPLVQAAQNVVPVAVTAAESVERLRTWANGRCLSANRAGIYQHETSLAGNTRRKISPRPSSN